MAATKMKILVVNGGSSSLKVDWIRIDPITTAPTSLARIAIDTFGPQSNVTIHTEGTKQVRKEPISGTGEGLRWSVAFLKGYPAFSVDVIGHRVVHGGAAFSGPTLITPGVLQTIKDFNDLAPLHNPIAVAAIQASQELFGDIPNVAVFDTAFHQNLPEVASTYALPHVLNERHRIRRYGFHGIAHQSMLHRYCELAGRASSEAKIITVQLGNGCSITAIRNGRSVDTSMGFSPGEGLIMGTRAGDMDSGLITWLARTDKLSWEQVDVLLNKNSGLAGISGGFSDIRDLLDPVRRENRQVRLALNLFCYRIRKYIGAYLAVLNGAEAIVFGGGIGEHQPLIRELVLQEMDWCGIRLDSEANQNALGCAARISHAQSSMAVWVIPVDEATLIAQTVASTLNRKNSA